MSSSCAPLYYTETPLFSINQTEQDEIVIVLITSFTHIMLTFWVNMLNSAVLILFSKLSSLPGHSHTVTDAVVQHSTIPQSRIFAAVLHKQVKLWRDTKGCNVFINKE